MLHLYPVAVVDDVLFTSIFRFACNCKLLNSVASVVSSFLIHVVGACPLDHLMPLKP